MTNATQLGEGGDGDWSAANDLLTFDRHDANGVNQLYVSRPDGSAAQCLSCAPIPGAPLTDRSKFNPSWHPSGKYIVVQGEMERHPLKFGDTNILIQELLVNGLWTDLYVTTADGSQWTKLTSTVSPETDGVLGPVFSPDGGKLFWSHLIGPASSSAPWGIYRLMLADFVVENGVPGLRNVRDITPSGGQFFEAHGFSPDSRKVLFASDKGAGGRWDMNIWTMDLTTREPIELTRNGSWNEHAAFTPDGTKISYMSTQPYPFTALKTDLMLMNADGTDKVQLTHFNTPGYPEYSPAQSTPGRARWSPDGTQLAVTSGWTSEFPKRKLYVLTFAGPCGG